MDDELLVLIAYSEIKVIVGARVRAALKAANKSHADLAEHLGVSRNTVTCWLNGTNSISVEYLIKIGRFLGVPHQRFSPDIGEQAAA